MPEEIVVIVIFSLVAFTGLSIVLMTNIRKYLEAKNGLGTGSGQSMKTSELEAMMERAARNAIAPVIKRIENLEATVVDEDLPNLLAESETYANAEELGPKIKVTRQSKS